MEENRHEHHHHHHHHDHEGNAPDKRLYALMNYMLSHNADHAKELEQLALKVKESGNDEAYEHTVEAVRFFSQGNDALKKALEHLESK